MESLGDDLIIDRPEQQEQVLEQSLIEPPDQEMILLIALDKLVRELRLLRGGTGLTLRKLRERPLVLAAVGCTPDEVQIAYDRLTAAIDALGNDQHVAALKNAYALEGLLGVRVNDRRREWSALNANSRDNGTIEDWENGVIDRLAARLLKPEDEMGHSQRSFSPALRVLDYSVVVSNRRTTSVALWQDRRAPDQPEESIVRYETYEVQSSWEPLACVIHRNKPGQSLSSVQFSLQWLDEHPPSSLWIAAHVDLFQLSLGRGFIQRTQMSWVESPVGDGEASVPYGWWRSSLAVQDPDDDLYYLMGWS